jgi:hypothetical protein
LTNLRLDNFSLHEPGGFVENLELARLESEATAPQFFGYMVAGFRNALRSVEQLATSMPEIPVDWVKEFLQGWGVNADQLPGLGPIDHSVLDDLLRAAKRLPLSEIPHPWLQQIRWALENPLFAGPAK